jgi:hypothetical protein
MTSIQDVSAPLARLTKKCIDDHLFGYAENFCNLLVALEAGRWDQVADDEQFLWLTRLSGLLHPKGLGDSWDTHDPDYRRVQDLVDGLLKARGRRE